MRPTQEYLERRFQAFNEQYFGGQLPTVPVRLTSARTYLGQLAFRRRRTLTGEARPCDFVLRISTRTDLPEHEVEDTLLHEMIHLYIVVNRLSDSSAHGPVFRRMMADINRRGGRHISIAHRRTAAEQDADTQRRLHLVCVTTFDTGERGVTVAARSRVFGLWDALSRFPHVVETRWLATYDPFFNRFPRALRPKVYRISGDDLEAHLKDAQPVRREGPTLYLGRR